MNKLIWCNRLAFFLLFLGAIILAFALTLQPKISDDWYLFWSFQKSAGALDYIIGQYTEVTGRLWLILLSTFVLPNPTVEIVYRAFIVIEIVLLAALAWYCALGPGAWRRTRENLQAMAIFGSLLWFALPERNETIAWTAGNFVYLVPALFGLVFIAWLERSMIASPTDRDGVRWHRRPSDILSFLLGFSAGVSHEQIVAACAAYLALIVLPVSRDLLLGRRKIGSPVWIGAAGLVIGAALLVSAPGNYVRMGQIAAPSLSDAIERMALYIPGAFFQLGMGATGKYIWLGALVFTLLYFGRGADKGEILAGLKRGVFWWMISLVSLLAMAPATNFISPRTAFFAVIFLYVGLAAMTCRPQSIAGDASDDSRATGRSTLTIPRLVLSTAVLTILGCLVVVEAVAGLISNASVAAEFVRRDEIVKQAMLSTTNGDKSPIRVPFIATHTAALTYVQNPEHDAAFLTNWGMHIGRTIEHDVSDGAPLPDSLKPLKTIKFHHHS